VLVGGIAVKKQFNLRPFMLYSPFALSSLYVFQSGSCVHAVVRGFPNDLTRMSCIHACL